MVAGCHAQAAPERPRSIVDSTLASDFNPATTGTIAGQIRWEGPQPQLPARRFFPTPTLLGSTHPHPHVPLIDPETQGIAEAVVFLREVEPRRARPWHHGRVRVEHTRRELLIDQDGRFARTGFVRRGDLIEVVSRDEDYHCLRGRGAVFFGIPLPDRNVISKRRLDQEGVIELTSGAGFYWMNAHLLVADHPYFARTDDQGRFALAQVPAGSYELVAWLPSWIERGHERDPETGAISRLLLAPPCEQRQQVHVVAGGALTISFTWSRRLVEK